MSRPTRDYADRHPRNKAPRKAARSGARKTPARGGGGGKVGLPAWAWMVVGLSAGLVVAAFVYIGRPAQPMDLAPSSAERSTPKAIELPPKEPSRFAFYEMLPSYEVVVSEDVLNAPPPKPAARPAVAPAAAAPTAAVDAPKPETAAQPHIAPAPVASGPQATAAERVAALQSAVAEEERRRAAAKSAPTGKPLTAPAAAAPAATATNSGERYLIQVAAYRSRADADQQRAALALAGLSARVEQVTIDQRETWFRVRLGPYSDTAAAQAAQRSLQAQGLKGVVMKVKS